MKQYAVVGHPVGHTMSPFLHGRLFALDGVEASYRALDLPDLEDPQAQETLAALDGYNVTIPYKQAVIPLLQRLDEKACRFGSVNTVKNEGGHSCGYTTDGAGFRYAVDAAGVGLSGRCVLLGSGGAARALAFEVLDARGALTLAVRDPSYPKGRALAGELLSRVPGAQVDCVSFSELEASQAGYDLLINATPVGMYPHDGVSPVSEAVVRRCAAVFDAVYNPAQTRLLAYAAQNGVKAVGGMAMLVGQAAAAHAVWNGASYRPAQLEALCREAAQEMERLFPRKKSVVLCGFMGSGKTTVGRCLAELSGREFLDLDRYIEERAGMEIRTIFETMGEGAFREMEAQAARELSGRAGLVIAAGGGTLLSEQNCEALRKNAAIVLLDVSAAALKERLRRDTARPLLNGPGGRNETIDRLLAERMPRYRAAADLVVDANLPPRPVARRVLEALGE